MNLFASEIISLLTLLLLFKLPELLLQIKFVRTVASGFAIKETYKGALMATALLPVLPVLLILPIALLLLLVAILWNNLMCTGINILKS